jgi:eukaryotic-like serine/threonine-protein kinase
MDAKRLALLKHLFAETCDMPVGERVAKLHALTDDKALIEEVLDLVTEGDAHTSRGTRASLSSPPVVALFESATCPELAEGDTLGAWRLKDELGHGGMGTVFLAERIDGHYQQHAAIKLLHGLPTTEALEYLAKERQILATLAHPNIARLLDGGATPQGRPYLVMEHVEGVPIDAYCREHKLGEAAIIKLFLLVCEGVSFAHQRLVVHCDLKPSNVMVERSGRPVLLDFGIARLLDSASARSDQVLRAFTPGYSSPEQRAGEAVSTASDVYSLGMMLKKLLNDAPYLGQKLAVSRELTAIIDMAGALDAQQRYPSVQQFQDDLVRLQRNLPVRAMPKSGVYIFAKLWQRRWPAFVASGLFLATVAGFTWRVVDERDRTNVARLTALQERDNAQLAQADAVQQRDRAANAEALALAERNRALIAEQAALVARDRARESERAATNAETKSRVSEATAQNEAATAKQVSAFMVAIFGNADPEKYLQKKSGPPTVAELVKIGGERVERDLKNQPATQAAMFTSLAMVYENMGQPKLSMPLYERALEVERSVMPPRPLELAKLLRRFSRMKGNIADYRGAEAMARESLALNERYESPHGRETGDSLIALSMAFSGVGNIEEAEPLLKRGIALRRATPQTPEAARIFTEDGTSWMQDFGQLYERAGQFAKAESYYRQAIDARRITFGDRHPRMLNSQQGLARMLAAQKKFAEAETILRNALALRLEIDEGDSIKAANVMGDLASVLQDRGKYTEALAIYREELALDERLAGKSLQYAGTLNNMGTLLEDMGDESAAETAYREALAIRERLLPAGDLRIARVRNHLGRLLTYLEKLDEAKPALDQALAERQKFNSTKFGESLDTLMVLIDWQRRKGNLNEAKRMLDDLNVSIKMANNARQLNYQRMRALVDAETGNVATALAALEKYETAMIASHGADNPRAMLAALNRINVLNRSGGEGDRVVAMALAKSTLASVAPMLPSQSSPLLRLKRLASESNIETFVQAKPQP